MKRFVILCGRSFPRGTSTKLGFWNVSPFSKILILYACNAMPQDVFTFEVSLGAGKRTMLDESPSRWVCERSVPTGRLGINPSHSIFPAANPCNLSHSWFGKGGKTFSIVDLYHRRTIFRARLIGIGLAQMFLIGATTLLVL